MRNCDLSNFNSFCGLSVKGINKIDIFDFGDLDNYEFDNDNPNIISSYTFAKQPISYKCLETSTLNSFLEENRWFKDFYRHELNVFFVKFNADNRKAFEGVKNRDLTIIVYSNDGKAYILGKETPIRLALYGGGLGSSETENGYNVTFIARQQYEIREIAPLLPCDANLQGTPLIASTFVIDDAIFRGYNNLTFFSDAGNFTHSPFNPFEPTSWANPTIYAQNFNELNTGINNFSGTSGLAVMVLDNINNEVIIQILSTDTTYTLLDVDGVVFTATNNVSLFLQLTVSSNYASTTSVQIDDNSGTVFVGALGDTVTGLGLSGIGQALYIDITARYANNPQTFTYILSEPSCPVNSYTFNYSPPDICGGSFERQLVAGNSYEIEIDKCDGEFYKTTIINIGGYQLTLYPTFAEFHSDFSVLEADVLARIAASPLGFVIDNIVMTEDIKSWKINFTSLDNNLVIWAFTVNNNTFNQNRAYYGKRKQSELGVYTIGTTTSAVIGVSDGFNIINGIANNVPTLANIPIENIYPVLNLDKTAQLGIVLNDYSLIPNFNFKDITVTCPLRQYNTTFNPCYDTFNSEVFEYQIYTLYVPVHGGIDLGSTFVVTTALGSYTLTLPSNVILWQNTDMLATAITENVLGVKCILAYIDQFSYELTLHLEIDLSLGQSVIQIDSFATNFNLIVSNNAYTVDLEPYQNPNISVQLDAFFNVVGNDTVLGAAQDDAAYITNTPFILADLTANYGADDVTVNFAVTETERGMAYIDFFNGFPDNGGFSTLLLGYSDSPSLGTASYPFQSGLTANGYTLTDVQFVRFRYDDGFEVIMPFADLTTIAFESPQIYPITLGKFNKIRVYTDFGVSNPVVTVTNPVCEI